MEKSIFLSKVTSYLSFYTHNSEIIFNNTFILFLLISTKSATLGRVFPQNRSSNFCFFYTKIIPK